MKSPKALYFYTNEATFVAKDLRSFRKEYDVRSHRFDVSAKWKLPFSFMKQTAFLLLNLFRARVLIIQFGGYHSLLPVIFGKMFGSKSAIVLGGYDCVRFPEIGYGAYFNRVMRLFVHYSYKWCDLLLPVHESLVFSDYRYADTEEKSQGYMSFSPDIVTPYKVVYNGYDSTFWVPGGAPKSGTFITVAGGLNEKRRRTLKGIDLVLELAEAMPNNLFTIIGSSGWGEPVPDNVRLMPFTPNAELLELYRAHEFYLQLSLSEGFPNALSEAMLSGCIPIVSNVSSMPGLVGKGGYVLERKSIEQLITLVRGVLSNPDPSKATLARRLIQENYSETKREQALLLALKPLF